MKLFRRKAAHARSAPESKPVPPMTAHGEVRKNGRLFLAVVASFLLMIALGAANIRLIGNPAAAVRALGKAPVIKDREVNPYAPPVLSTDGEKVCYVPPQLTFYRKLATQDERDWPGKEARASDSSNSAHETHTQATGTGPPDVEPPKTSSRATESTCPPHPVEKAARPTALPTANTGEKRYTVQVGAFTHPGIARQWAARWKAKGYHVSLKPVARPSTGVIHRLYLGNFSSPRKADELVKRLKTKEGIDAFRLVLRN